MPHDEANRDELSMRWFALRRKSWLFVANIELDEPAAKFVSIVSSAKLQILDKWMQDYPEAVQVYREEENRYKADRIQGKRAPSVLAAKLKLWKTADQTEGFDHHPGVSAYGKFDTYFCLVGELDWGSKWKVRKNQEWLIAKQLPRLVLIDLNN